MKVRTCSQRHLIDYFVAANHADEDILIVCEVNNNDADATYLTDHMKKLGILTAKDGAIQKGTITIVSAPDEAAVEELLGVCWRKCGILCFYRKGVFVRGNLPKKEIDL